MFMNDHLPPDVYYYHHSYTRFSPQGMVVLSMCNIARSCGGNVASSLKTENILSYV